MDSVSIYVVYICMMYIAYIGECLLDSRSERVSAIWIPVSTGMTKKGRSDLHGNDEKRKITLNKMNTRIPRKSAQIPPVAAIFIQKTEHLKRKAIDYRASLGYDRFSIDSVRGFKT